MKLIAKILGGVVDLLMGLIAGLFFLFLELRGRNVAVSVEGYLQFSKGSIFDRILGFLTSGFGWLTYWESEVFRCMPGGGIHITALKPKQ